MDYSALPFLIFTMIFVYIYYYTYIVGFFKVYPEPVAVELRKALYFTNQSLDVQRAIKYFVKAQKIAIEQENMDPFSDEVIGIRLLYGSLFEKAQMYQKAIQVYETIYAQNMKWLEEVGIREGWMGRRNKVLQKTIKTAVKLGDLYANEYVMERDLAEEKMVWAIETGLKEIERREKDGVAPGEGKFMSAEETGAAMESEWLCHAQEATLRGKVLTSLKGWLICGKRDPCTISPPHCFSGLWYNVQKIPVMLLYSVRLTSQ